MVLRLRSFLSSSSSLLLELELVDVDLCKREAAVDERELDFVDRLRVSVLCFTLEDLLREVREGGVFNRLLEDCVRL